MRRVSNLLFIVFGLLCVVIAGVQPGLAEPVSWRVLLIGVDDYKAPHISDLRGCGNDVELMRSVLIDKFSVPPENVKMLKDAQATRQGILEAIQNHLIEKARAGDIVILHYSGHGSQMLDGSGDEIDGYDETIVPHDSRTGDVFDISDDEINGLLTQLTEKTKNVTFIFDSCHSGSAARGGNTVRMIEPDNRPPPSPETFAITTRGAGEGESGFRLEGSDYVLISGCLATELSNETMLNGNRHGVLTWFLVQALRSAEENSTYKSVMDEVGSEVSNRYASQHPQIEGPGADLRVFGTDRINSSPYVLVESVNGQQVGIGGGRVYGLGKGSVLDVYPPGTTDFEGVQPEATINITEVDDFTASAVVQEGGPVSVHSKVSLTAVGFGDGSVPVYIDKDVTVKSGQLGVALKKLAGVRVVDDQQDARLILSVEGGHILIQNGDLEAAAPRVPLSAPDHKERVVQQVSELIHWVSVMDLKNSLGTIRIGFDIRRAEDPVDTPAPKEVAPDARLTYRVQNLDSVPLYIYVLDVSSDGSIALLYPEVGGAQEVLPAGKTLERTIETFVPEGRSAVVDVFKVIATTKPINAAVFPQKTLTRAAVTQVEKTLTDPLEFFLFNSISGSRGSRPVEVKSWATKQQTVTIRRQGVRFAGFSIHFGEVDSGRKLPTSFGLSRSTCQKGEASGQEDCFRFNRVSPDGTTWELIQEKAARGDSETVASVGQAFEEAYRMLDQFPGAARVEPLLEVEVPGVLDQRGIEKRDISSDVTHDQHAMDDDQWHFKQIRVAEAWKKIRAHHGVAEGGEANGLLVAHIDTGYRDHPETWKEVEGKRPVDPVRGYDYYDGDEDPLDPLLDDRFLDNPGHGTASGSVIVSPAGCQLENAEGCVNGVARGAQLVPLRVNRTVSQFNTANLSKAIRDVAEGRISGQPKLISIAMGGPPTLSMWKAVRKAEKNGVLVVAAAGNYVRTVVWPARFRSTIAVAAIGVQCRPWKHSSRGSKVDISSPGESVWRASFNKEKEFINGMGKGTTFATGNTSGAAGLWLAYHSDNPKLTELQEQGKITRTFRQALKKSSWQPGVDGSGNPAGTYCSNGSWDTSRYGSGILDVAALLDVELDSEVTEAQVANEEELADLPLFSSLYPEGSDPEQIRTDYRALYGKKRAVDNDKQNVFETEILYHYTMNENVQRTVDALVGGQRAAGPADQARGALLRQDLSQRLRTSLMQ